MDFSDEEELGNDVLSRKKFNFQTKQLETTETDTESYRVSFTTEEEALEWLKMYEDKSKTHWIVNKTFPNPDR